MVTNCDSGLDFAIAADLGVVVDDNGVVRGAENIAEIPNCDVFFKMNVLINERCGGYGHAYFLDG